VADSMQASVTSASPLLVRVDGADTACPAAVLYGASYSVGQRVQITIRTPQAPLVTGRVS
jgi:hypothetical protein